jgi:hypothetical protein
VRSLLRVCIPRRRDQSNQLFTAKKLHGSVVYLCFCRDICRATNLEGMCGVLQIDGRHEAREIAAMHANIASRRFPPPWTVEDIGAFFS